VAWQAASVQDCCLLLIVYLPSGHGLLVFVAAGLGLFDSCLPMHSFDTVISVGMIGQGSRWIAGFGSRLQVRIDNGAVRL
jgi:hypothetical protein